MKKILTICVVTIFCFVQCNTGTAKYDRLVQKYDSLEQLEINSQKIIHSLEEVVIMIDSVDIVYEGMAFDLEVGTDYKSYSDKMELVNLYIRKANERIESLENANASNVSLLARLKKELELKSIKINELELAVEDLKSENFDLYDMIAVQSQTLHNKSVELELKSQEVKLIEAQVVELMKQADLNEANAYFARASALEEAANRTKLAPKKKREALKKAMLLFEEALRLGNQQAKTKVERLREKVR